MKKKSDLNGKMQKNDQSTYDSTAVAREMNQLLSSIHNFKEEVSRSPSQAYFKYTRNSNAK